ncbi:hypothetical protein ACIQTU_06695 [Brevundimonas sp. NPDC090276]|uniref:hypothetical protein n=1 Tax=Brevundimonas sp. NPDC090276 TaxID=3363956 RepID=UPI00383BEC97
MGIAVGLTLMTFSPTLAVAQDSGTSTQPGNERARGERVLPGRIGGDRNERRQQQRQRQQAPAPADPAVIKAEVEAIFASASTPCQVTEAKMLGVSAEQVKIYEASCAGAAGYIVVASTPPQLADCIVLANQAADARAANPEAPPSQTCSLAGNQDVMGVLKSYATQAGIACTVDEAKVRGQTGGGAVVYEIGCAGADGYWIEKNASGWEKTECLQVVSQNSTCLFTTPAEQAATVKSWLPGSDAAACDVQQVRLMGQNANGRFIEMTCAGADGFIIRQNAEHAVQQVYPCATAQQIGGGCKLTTTPPAATPQA